MSDTTTPPALPSVAEYVPLYVRENPDHTVTYDPHTGLPVIADADMFYTFCRDPHLTPQMRHELVEVAARGPLRKRLIAATGLPVPQTPWFSAILARPELTEEELLRLAAKMPPGRTTNLGDLTRALVCHPAATDTVVCRFVLAAKRLRDHTGAPVKIPSVLEALQELGHPAGAAYRLTFLPGAGPDYRDPESYYVSLTDRVRELGPAAARAAQRLVTGWAGSVGELFDVVAGIGAPAPEAVASTDT